MPPYRVDVEIAQLDELELRYLLLEIPGLPAAALPLVIALAVQQHLGHQVLQLLVVLVGDALAVVQGVLVLPFAGSVRVHGEGLTADRTSSRLGAA